MSHDTTPLPEQPPYDEPAARRVKVAHLVLGLVLLGIAGIWALDAAGLASWTVSRYLAPAVLVVAGLAGLAVSLLPGCRRS
ncbi:MAG: hypothetical protein ACTHNS_13515 [Marmoricola sp.]